MLYLLKFVKILSTKKLIKYLLVISIIFNFLFYRKNFFTKKNSRQVIVNSKITIEKRLKLFLFGSIFLTFKLANFIFLFPFRDIALLILISNAIFLTFAVWRFISFGGYKMFLLSLLSEVCIVTQFFVYLHDYFFDERKPIYFIIIFVLCVATYFISKNNMNRRL